MNLVPAETIGYINAGGRGTRLNDVFVPDPEMGIAKALLAIGTPPVRLVDHHISNLRDQGVERIVIAAGDQHEVYEYVNDIYPQEEDVSVTSSLEQLGTGGDLVSYTRQLSSDARLLVQNVDTILDIDLEAFQEDFARSTSLGGLACIALTKNAGVPNEGAYAVNRFGKVEYSAEFQNSDRGTSVIKSVTYRASSTGAVMFDANFIRERPWQLRHGQFSIYQHILRQACDIGGLYAYDNGLKFFRDVGLVATWLCSQSDVELQQHLRYNTVGKQVETT